MLEGVSINLFSGGADHLRHLDLSFFPIFWSSRLLSQLETLTIMGSPTVPGPSTSELTYILRQCPRLYEFVMTTSGEIRVLGDTRSEVGIAHLPALESFTLHLQNPEAFNRILSSVRIPGCTTFSLECSRATRNIFSNEISHITTALLSAIRSTPDISLTLSSSHLNLFGRYTEDDPTIEISLIGDSPWEILASLIELSVLWPPINAYICCNELPSLQVADLLRRTPYITELHLTGNSDRYIAQLLQPTLNNGKYEWVLPNLGKLWLEDCPENSLSLLTALVERRREGIEMDQGEGVRSRLDKVHVAVPYCGRNQEMRPLYSALRMLKGEHWDGDMMG
ncbi:hypothetical protein FRB94_011635 [Tulasnella sp. JGI-2019a]|nr:hypothetical protein FRB94_011635 [Tulasnella sp. JGI-2019a]